MNNRTYLPIVESAKRIPLRPFMSDETAAKIRAQMIAGGKLVPSERVYPRDYFGNYERPCLTPGLVNRLAQRMIELGILKPGPKSRFR
jgi:hypothetical protein